MKKINWNMSDEDALQVDLIAERAWKNKTVRDMYQDRVDLCMDITATHLNGCPLRLKELRHADDFNFFHDIFGIASHIDRKTAKIKNHFLPRFSQPVKVKGSK